MTTILIIFMSRNDNQKDAPLESLFLLEKEIKQKLGLAPDDYALVVGLYEIRDRINGLFQAKIDILTHGGAMESHIRNQIEACVHRGASDG